MFFDDHGGNTGIKNTGCPATTAKDNDCPATGAKESGCPETAANDNDCPTTGAKNSGAQPLQPRTVTPMMVVANCLARDTTANCSAKDID